MIKKIFCIVLSTIMVTSVMVSANETEMIDIDAVLLNRGYPKVVLDTMDSGAKKDIYDDSDLYFASAELLLYDEETQVFEKVSISDNGIMPLGQIPTTDLTLNWTTSVKKVTSGSKKGALNYIDVKYSYNWTKLPLFRWQDPIAISWDDDKFRIKDDSFYKVDKYDGYTTEVDGAIKTFTDKVKSSEYGYANAYSAGVTWYADLKGYDGFNNITRLHGYSSFQLVPKSTMYSGFTTLYGHYVHPTISINSDISIGSYGCFSVSGGSNYDERGNQTTISWSNITA